MTIDDLAAVVSETCLAEGVPHMFTGAFATALYGSPRSTADVDVVVDVSHPTAMPRLVARLGDIATFDARCSSTRSRSAAGGSARPAACRR